jgi:hypothetical protein
MYLAKHNVMELEHLPYSLHLSPSNLLLFPQLKIVLKGWFMSAVEVAAK